MRKTSLKNGLLLFMVLCWIMPIIIIMTLAGAMFSKNYHTNIRQAVDTATDSAMIQIRRTVDNAIQDSKSVSYDGVIRNSYREYQETGDRAELYRSANNYLNQKFARSTDYQAVFLHFWEDQIGFSIYCMSSGLNSNSLLARWRADLEEIEKQMQEADTATRFLAVNGRLYMARNMVDGEFQPYASVVMVMDPAVVFQPLSGMSRVREVRFQIDDTLCIWDTGEVVTAKSYDPEPRELDREVKMEDHVLRFSADMEPYDIWRENSGLILAATGAAIMLLPLLLIMIYLFYRNITDPVETLVRANRLVEGGERGYEIREKAPNQEFENLYLHFNEMSKELQKQFERSYQEQQAAQEAQIKALQSQINPHFLNNTLEIINWEARIAGNDRISEMLESLSTMLGAALARDGRTRIPLREELGYVNAYLYITGERLGGALSVNWEIREEMKDRLIPRLILQPIVENAVEHDITDRRGGALTVRAYTGEGQIFLEVEHDGGLNPGDRDRIRVLLSDEEPGLRQVGLRNVYQRLRLLYGEAGRIEIRETDHGTVLARITFPEFDKIA